MFSCLGRDYVKEKGAGIEVPSRVAYNGHMNLTDTIVAISTALQESAISIIRLSGEDAIVIADSLFSKDLTKADSHTITYGHLIDPIKKEAIDEVLISVFRAPRSFTCENVVEINCHGGVIISQEILSLCISQGARIAEPGEFTERAMLNGRIDLTQAEATMDIIQARSINAAQLAVQGIQGSVKPLIEPLQEDLIQIIATIEVNIDYPEYDDVEMLTNEIVLPKAKAFLAKLKEIVDVSTSGKIIRDGVKTVILGKPNVGKSSLLNALLDEDKAIVTDIEGTTRDLVEGWIRLQNVDLHLIDTAGLRETQDKVEQIGIDRSRKALESAELVIFVIDGSKPISDEDKELIAMTDEAQRIIVTNKKEFIQGEYPGIHISALHQDIQPLVDEINQRFERHKIALKQPTLVNQRQIGAAKRSYLAMERAILGMEAAFELDLVTIDLNEAYVELSSILVGNKDEVNVLDEIFSRFCLGK